MPKCCEKNMTLMRFKDQYDYIRCDHWLCEECGEKQIMQHMKIYEWYNSLTNVIVYTDGSVSANGKPEAVGGWACILQEYKTKWIMSAELEKFGKLVFETDNLPVTNNRAEIYAVLKAMESINKPCKITVWSDSELCVKTINCEYSKKTNLDLWDRVDSAMAELERIGCDITVRWCKGHAGNVMNERCDKLAGAAKRG